MILLIIIRFLNAKVVLTMRNAKEITDKFSCVSFYFFIFVVEYEQKSETKACGCSCSQGAGDSKRRQKDTLSPMGVTHLV
jgi:hypothetical protein